jgi:hypothetical protein
VVVVMVVIVVVVVAEAAFELDFADRHIELEL